MTKVLKSANVKAIVDGQLPQQDTTKWAVARIMTIDNASNQTPEAKFVKQEENEVAFSETSEISVVVEETDPTIPAKEKAGEASTSTRKFIMEVA